MILDQLYPRKINESLADEFMAMAKAKGMNPRLRGTPDEERARTNAMLKQRAADRANAPKPQPIDAETRAHLQDQLKSLEATFDPNYEYSDDYSFWKEQSNIAQQIDRIKAALARGISESRQRKLNEAQLMEDPIYRKFKGVGRYIAERRMSEKEILQVFADAEAGMTDKGTGANRTMLGRGKDTTMDFAGGVADAVKSVLGSIQNSVPVAAVDVAYDQATDALANVAGGQKGKVMQAIKGYRNLVKQYPKTAGFAKAALIAIAGLATGGAGLPAIAGLTYALDSAIKGDKLSSVIGKGAGAAAVTWGGQQVAGMLGGQPGAEAGGFDPSQMPAYDDAGNLMPGWHINPESGQPYWNGELSPGNSFAGATDAAPGADTFGGGTYTIEKGDQLGYIAQANGVSVEDIRGMNPQIDFSKPLQPGTEITLPVAGTPGQGSVWQGYQGGMYGDKAASPELLGGGDASNFAGATTPSGPTVSFPDGGTNGTLTLPDGSQMEVSAYPEGGIQPRLGPGNESVQVNYAGQDVTAYIKNGKAYIKNFNPQEFSNPVQESWLPVVKLRRLSADKLIDQKSTVMSWALSESIGVKSKSMHLTTAGTYTVFENVDRYRQAIMEKAGVPGSTRPEYYRPDMSGAPAPTKPPKNQSWFGKGLDYLDKGVKKVGGALSNFGHQFTTNVTKEKLKMNWHQAGKPSDSDQLAAWLIKQGVPQEVVTSVYGKMGIPYTAPATTNPATTEPAKAEPAATKTGGAQRSMPFYGTNPATKKPWTYDELQAKSQAGATTPAPTTQPTATTTATQPVGFNATNVMNLPGMQTAKKPATAPAKTPNFAGPTGYGKTTTSFKGMTGIPGMNAPATPTAPKAPAAPKAPGIKYNINLPAGGGAGVKAAAQPGQLSKDEYIRRIGAPAMPESRVFNALKKPVAEMLQMVETKEDVKRIKQFIDQTFVKYGAVSESAFTVRNKLIEHVTQVGAQRRREFARKG